MKYFILTTALLFILSPVDTQTAKKNNSKPDHTAEVKKLSKEYTALADATGAKLQKAKTGKQAGELFLSFAKKLKELDNKAVALQKKHPELQNTKEYVKDLNDPAKQSVMRLDSIYNKLYEQYREDKSFNDAMAEFGTIVDSFTIINPDYSYERDTADDNNTAAQDDKTPKPVIEKNKELVQILIDMTILCETNSAKIEKAETPQEVCAALVHFHDNMKLIVARAKELEKTYPDMIQGNMSQYDEEAKPAEKAINRFQHATEDAKKRFPDSTEIIDYIKKIDAVFDES